MLWLLLLAVAHAAQIVSRSPVVHVVRGQLLLNQSLTVQCAYTDYNQTTEFTVTDASGEALGLRVTCHAPRYVFAMVGPLAYVPRDGRLHRHSACSMRNPSATGGVTAQDALSRAVDDPRAAFGARRRLLAAPNHAYAQDLYTNCPWQLPADPQLQIPEGWYDDISGNVSIPGPAVYQRPTAGDVRARSPTFLGAPSFPFFYFDHASLRCVLAGCFRDVRDYDVTIRLGTSASDAVGVDCKNIINYVQTRRERELQAATEGYFRQMLEGERARDASFLNLTAGLADIYRNVTRLQRELGGSNGTLALRLDALERDLMNRTNLTKQQLLGVDARTLRLHDLLNATGGTLNATLIAAFGAFYNATDQLSARYAASFASVKAGLEDMWQRDRRALRGTQQALADATTTLLGNLERRDILRTLIRLVRADLVAEHAREGRNPFLRDRGLDPEPFVGDLPLDDVFLAYTTPNGGSTLAHQHRLAYRCDARRLVNNVRPSITWDQILLSLGPAGCDPSTAGNCTCYAEWVHNTCTLAPGGAAAANWTERLALTYPGVCTAEPTRLTRTTYTEGVGFVNELRNLCTLLTGSDYQAASVYAGRRVTFANDGSQCQVDEDGVADGSVHASPLAVVLGFWALSYGRLSMAFDVLFDELEGTLPLGLSFAFDDFARRRGQSAQCVVASFMSYTDADLLPVYRLVPQRVEARVTVETANGVPVEYGPTEVSLGLANVLPHADFLLVGRPDANDTVFDVPQSELSLSPFAAARAGHVTYALAPNASAFSLATWEALAGVSFDHTAGTNVAQQYAVAINASTNRCVFEYGLLGSWCGVRARFSVEANANATELDLVPRTHSSFTAQISVPAGDLTALVVSVCPRLVLLPQPSGVLAQMNDVRSPQAPASLLTLHAEFPGAPDCPARHETTSVVAGGRTGVFLPYCDGATTIAVSVFRLVEDLALAPCEGQQSVEVPAQAAQGEMGVATVDTVSVAVADTTLRNLDDLAQRTRGLLLDGLLGVAHGLSVIGFPLLNGTFDAVLSRFGNVTLYAVASPYVGGAGGNASVAPVAPRDAAADYAAALAAARAAGDTAQLDVSAQMAALQARQSDLNAQVALLANVTRDLTEARDLWRQAKTNLTRAVLDRFSRLYEWNREVTRIVGNGGWGALGRSLGPLRTVGAAVATAVAYTRVAQVLGLAVRAVTDLGQEAVTTVAAGVRGLFRLVAYIAKTVANEVGKLLDKLSIPGLSPLATFFLFGLLVDASVAVAAYRLLLRDPLRKLQ